MSEKIKSYTFSKTYDFIQKIFVSIAVVWHFSLIPNNCHDKTNIINILGKQTQAAPTNKRNNWKKSNRHVIQLTDLWDKIKHKTKTRWIREDKMFAKSEDNI